MSFQLKGYPKGSDLTILDCWYNYRRKGDDGKYNKDFLTIVFRDNVTGEKHHEIIYEPEYTFYKIKEGYVQDYPLLFIDRDKTESYTVKYSEIEKEIAALTGNTEAYKANIACGNRIENKRLHTIPSIMFSDMSIEDYYRFLFSKTYTNDLSPKLNKSYFDIEVDTKYMAGRFVEMGECPVNAVTFLDERTERVITFLLRNGKNPLIQEFEDEYKSGKFGQKEIAEFVETNVGGRKKVLKNKLENLNYKIVFFDEEIELLKALFFVIHSMSPDFCMGWNSSGFDLQYIIERCYALGYEPADIMTDLTWEYGQVKNYVDQRNYSLFAERGDYTIITGHTVFIDQMIQYASRRKSKIGSIKSFKLDDIAYSTAKVHKLSYKHITTDIAQLPYLDYKTFVLYNIMDVIAQKCIENKAQDMGYIFNKCVINNTSYKKGHRQTVYLINRFASEFWDKGLVIGNNVNKWNDEPEVKFPGAFVAKPLLTNNYAKIFVDGRPILLCDNCQDYDYKSLYPSIMAEFNIAPNTQIGRIEIPEKVYEDENAWYYKKYSRSGEFIENLVTDNPVEFAHRWLHLANFNEMIEDMNEFYSVDNNPDYIFGPAYNRYEGFENTGVFRPVYDIPKDQLKICPVSFTDGEWRPQGVRFYSTLQQSGMSNDYKTYLKEEKINATL